MKETSEQKLLVHGGGRGFALCFKHGVYEVRSHEGKKTFYDFNKAKEHYESLQGEKEIWNMLQTPKLLDSYHYVDMDKQETCVNLLARKMPEKVQRDIYTYIVIARQKHREEVMQAYMKGRIHGENKMEDHPFDTFRAYFNETYIEPAEGE
jgi:hypothetical protein